METDNRDTNSYQDDDILNITFQLKEEVQSICEKLASYGEESVFISTNKTENTSSCRGSKCGLDFVLKKLDIIDQFYQYCRGNNVNKENSEILVGHEIGTDPEENICTFNGISSFNDQISNHSPIEKSIFKEDIKPGGETEDGSYETRNRYCEYKQNEPEFVSLKRAISSALSESNSTDTHDGTLSKGDNSTDTHDDTLSKGDNSTDTHDDTLSQGDNSTDTHDDTLSKGDNFDSNIDLDMCLTDGNEENAEQLINIEESDVKLTDIEFNDSQINAKNTGTEVFKSLDTESCLPLSGKKTQVVNKRVMRVSLLRKGMIASGIKNETIKDRKLVSMAESGAKMFIVPVKKKCASTKRVIDYSTPTLQDNSDSVQLASGFMDTFEPIHVFKTENLESKIGDFKQLKSSENSMTSSVSQNSIVYPGERNEQLPVKSKEEVKKWISNNDDEVEDDVKSYNVFHKKYDEHNPTGRDKRHECKLCGRTYKFKMNLKDHMFSHGDKLRYACSMCDRRFSKHEYLQTHVNNHLEIKSFMCEVCGKQFASSRLLRMHAEVHLEQIHTCKICDKDFVRRRSLLWHMRIHKGERKYTNMCEECGKRFYARKDLNRHYLVHTGKKPFRCELCPYECNQRGNLKVHMKVHNRI